MPHAPVLITRPAAQAQRFAHQVTARLGPGPILVSPLMGIAPTDVAPDFSQVAAVIFTSANAVHMLGGPVPTGMTAYCVGAETARVAKNAGFTAMSADGDWRALCDLILDQPNIGPLLHLHGAHVRGDIIGTLRKAGRSAQALMTYTQIEQAPTDEALRQLSSTDPMLIPLFSPRTAQILSPWLESAAAKLHVAAISPAVATALPVHSADRLEVASEPTANALLDLLAVLQVGLRA